MFLQHLQHADVSKSLCAASAQRKADFLFHVSLLHIGKSWML